MPSRGLPGFGTQALPGMLAHELGARTDLDFQEDGLCCSIDFILADRIGALAERAEIEIRR